MEEKQLAFVIWVILLTLSTLLLDAKISMNVMLHMDHLDFVARGQSAVMSLEVTIVTAPQVLQEILSDIVKILMNVTDVLEQVGNVVKVLPVQIHWEALLVLALLDLLEMAESSAKISMSAHRHLDLMAGVEFLQFVLTALVALIAVVHLVHQENHLPDVPQLCSAQMTDHAEEMLFAADSSVIVQNLTLEMIADIRVMTYFVEIMPPVNLI